MKKILISLIALLSLMAICNNGVAGEASDLGIGGARIWYQHYIEVQLQYPGTAADMLKVNHYELGMNYAVQYCASAADREEFARAFETELGRLAAQNTN